MKYQGPLYGKIGKRTFDTGKTSCDWDRMESFVRICRDDFDCDADAHRYGTMCRACEAKKVLTPRTDEDHHAMMNGPRIAQSLPKEYLEALIKAASSAESSPNDQDDSQSPAKNL